MYTNSILHNSITIDLKCIKIQHCIIIYKLIKNVYKCIQYDTPCVPLTYTHHTIASRIIDCYNRTVLNIDDPMHEEYPFDRYHDI